MALSGGSALSGGPVLAVLPVLALSGGPVPPGAAGAARQTNWRLPH
jgi:hypothetical protein